MRVSGFTGERDATARNLRAALAEVQRRAALMVADLDRDPTRGTYGGAARNLVSDAGEVARLAGELDMANRLTFLLPDPKED
ncbi:hypothetical protein ACFFWE_09625 [Sphaerisporangium melleum]|uniref:hypothetical protein n=1 Tax=Sphaerisporangium melleum TaxID=321316 RepID=UPI00166AD56A|nr:hypothetical protein [Sphaerisporangium melleum]